MWNAFAVVFFRVPYLAFAAVIAVGLFTMVTWLPNKALLMLALSHDTISFWGLIGATPQFFMANTTPISAVMTGLVMLLAGINGSMLVYYLKRRVARDRAAGLGALGMVLGILGIGCAACGSIILSSLVGIGAAARVVGVLPFGGNELSVVGILLLGYSISQIANKITNPATCVAFDYEKIDHH